MLIDRIIFQKTDEPGWINEGGGAVGITLIKDGAVTWDTEQLIDQWGGSAPPNILFFDASPEEGSYVLFSPMVEADRAIISTAGFNLLGHKFFFNGQAYTIPAPSPLPFPATISEEINFLGEEAGFNWLPIAGIAGAFILGLAIWRGGRR